MKKMEGHLAFSKALLPLLFTTILCGTGAIQYPLGKPRPLLSIVYIIIYYSVCMFTFFCGYKLHYSVHMAGVLTLAAYFNILVTGIMMFIYVYYNDDYCKCLKRLSLLNDTLEKMGIPNEYKRLRRLTIYAICGWILSMLIMNCTSFLWLNEINFVDFILSQIFFYASHIGSLTNILFITLLRYAENRFKWLNKYIGRRCQPKERNEYPYFRRTILSELMSGAASDIVSLRCYDIWIAMQVHLELCKICNIINKIFQMQINLEIISYFVITIGIINEIYVAFNNFQVGISIKTMVNCLLWGTFCIFKLFTVNYTCEVVSAEANRSDEIVETAVDYVRSNVREEVFQFISQINYKRLRFSVNGYYYLGYSLMWTFFQNLTTITIIILQMKGTL